MNTTQPRLCRFLIGITGLMLVVFATAPAIAKVKISVSAPILPKQEVIWGYENTNYPMTLEGQEQAVEEASMTFEELLAICAPDYPGITILADDSTELTAEQLAANYRLVAQCSYEKFMVKPYWIPQLVNDVDICGGQLGAGWELLTEDDVLGLKDKEIEFLNETLTGVSADAADFWGPFYFSLKVFVRGNDGTLKMGDLTTGVTERILPLPLPQNGSMLAHLEGGPAGTVVVRCILVEETPDAD